jgi:hypothetical protein
MKTKNFALRLKPELHEKIKQLALKDERSINQTINRLLEKSLKD